MYVPARGAARVTFEFLYGVAAKDYNEVAKIEHLKPIEVSRLFSQKRDYPALFNHLNCCKLVWCVSSAFSSTPTMNRLVL